MSDGPWTTQKPPKKFRAKSSAEFKRLAAAYRRALGTNGEARARRDLEDFLAARGLSPRERAPFLRSAKSGPPTLRALHVYAGDGAE